MDPKRSLRTVVCYLLLAPVLFALFAFSGWPWFLVGGFGPLICVMAAGDRLVRDRVLGIDCARVLGNCCCLSLPVALACFYAYRGQLQVGGWGRRLAACAALWSLHLFLFGCSLRAAVLREERRRDR